MQTARSLLALALVLVTACAADVDNVREPVAPPAVDAMAPELTAVEPNHYTVYLASDDARAVAAVDAALERLNGAIGYDAFVWGEGAGEPSDWAITIKVDAVLDHGPAVAVTAGAGSWCDMTVSPERALNRFVLQHEIGHCFDLEHSEQRDSWMFFGPDYRTDVIPSADVETMVARLKAGW